MIKNRSHRFWIGCGAWISVAIYYLYQYTIRVSPMVMVNDISIDFSLDASGFGALMFIATFFYAAFQIPMGILSDLFSARKVVLGSLIGCVVGVGLFSKTDHLLVAYGARALMGIGSAAAFLCVSKVSSEWFPPEQKSLWFAATVVMGTIGALFGGGPMAVLVEQYGWRESLWILTLIGLGVLALNFLALNPPKENMSPLPREETPLQNQLKEVFTSKISWLYAVVGMGMYSCISVFSDLWGAPFFQEKYGLTRELAAQIISASYLGTCLGVIVTALFARALGGARYIIGGSALLVAIIAGLVVYGQGFSPLFLMTLMFLLGFFVSGEVLCFSEACIRMDPRVAATVTGFLNFVITLGGAGLQILVGTVLDWVWEGRMSTLGGRLYSSQDYEKAFAVMVIATVSSVIIAFFLPPDKPQQKGPQNP